MNIVNTGALLFEPDGTAVRPLSKKENDAGWRAFLQALEVIGKSPVLVAAYEALSASLFDPCEDTRTPKELLLLALTDAELDLLDDLMVKSTQFDRPADRDAAYTALRFRQTKRSEASALTTNERMRRLIKSTVAATCSPQAAPAPTSSRSRRAGL